MDANSIDCRLASRRFALELQDYIIIDVETTGLSPEKDAIIEVSALRVRGNEPAESYTSFINPYRHIPKQITELTGITETDLMEAPDAELVAEDLAAFIGNDVLVAHNAMFDIKFLAHLFDKVDMRMENTTYIDTLRLAREAYPELPNHKLSTLIEYLNLSAGAQPHRAFDDVEFTLELLLACREKLLSSFNGYKKSTVNDSACSTNVEEHAKSRKRKGTSTLQIIAYILLAIGVIGCFASTESDDSLETSLMLIALSVILFIWDRKNNKKKTSNNETVLGEKSDGYFSRQEARREQQQKEAQQSGQRIIENKSQGIACCPRCGSTSLSAGQKGFGVGKAVVGAVVAGPIGLVAGNIGKHKVKVTCLNCGHSWKL